MIRVMVDLSVPKISCIISGFTELQNIQMSRFNFVKLYCSELLFLLTVLYYINSSQSCIINKSLCLLQIF